MRQLKVIGWMAGLLLLWVALASLSAGLPTPQAARADSGPLVVSETPSSTPTDTPPATDTPTPTEDVPATETADAALRTVVFRRTQTATAATATAIAAETETAIPPTLTAAAQTQTALPPTLTAAASAQTPLPTSPAPEDTPAPGPIVVDPLITKEQNLELAKVGDEVLYTLIATNPNSISIDEVSTSDTLPRQLDFVGASTDQGQFTFDAGSNTITFLIGTLGPGQRVVMTIRTRVNALAQPGDQLRNAAIINVGPAPRGTSNVVVLTLTPGSVPGTGLPPDYSSLFTWILVVLAVLTPPGLWWWLRRAQPAA